MNVADPAVRASADTTSGCPAPARAHAAREISATAKAFSDVISVVDLVSGVWDQFVIWAHLNDQTWTGVGGLAQILAALLTVVTVRQARTMIEQQDGFEWGIGVSSAGPGIGDYADVIFAKAWFRNLGPGWAYKHDVETMELHSGIFATDPPGTQSTGTNAWVREPGESIVVHFDWPKGNPPFFKLRISARTRRNRRISQDFVFQGFETADGRYECLVRAPESWPSLSGFEHWLLRARLPRGLGTHIWSLLVKYRSRRQLRLITRIEQEKRIRQIRKGERLQ